MRKYFQRTEDCLEKFWSIWQDQYLKLLLERHNKQHQQSRLLTRRTPKRGEIVLLQDEQTPRGLWKLAKIVELPKSADNAVRSATILTVNKKLLQRPISQLYPLEISEKEGTDINSETDGVTVKEKNSEILELRQLREDPNLQEESAEEPTLTTLAIEAPKADTVDTAREQRQKKTEDQCLMATNFTAQCVSTLPRPKTRNEATTDKKDRMSWSRTPLFWTVALLALVFPKGTNAVIAYDCSHRNLNITAIDVTTVGGCETTYEKPEIGEQTIQLIQLADEYPVTVKQCKVTITRHITHCGMHSHASEVLGGLATFVYEIGSSRCKELHSTGTIQLQGNVIMRDLTVGSIHTRQVVFAGSVNPVGDCEGGPYSDAFGSWNKVLVQGTVQVKLATYSSKARTDRDEIRLRSQYLCKFSSGYCMDAEEGETVWEMSPEESCSKNKHQVLYEGLAKTVVSKTRENPQEKITTYTVEAGQKIFALRITNPYRKCAFMMFMTEHPKLIIVPRQSHGFYFEKKPVPPGALDLLTYMNSKFVYVNKNIGDSIEEVFQHLSLQRCALEQKILNTQLTLATINPIEFAYSYTGKPGYTANTLGEVVYLIKCEPVEVTVRKTERCYAELPVAVSNRSMFMTPRTRLLQARGTEVTCNVFLRPMYRLFDAWYALSPSLVPAQPPTRVQPAAVTKYKFLSPADLATGGIYDETEIERLRDQIMYPGERNAMTNVITRGIAGRRPDMQGLSVGHLMDESTVEKLKNSLVAKIWGSFTVFGTVVSGILGIVIAAKIAKWTIDTIFHGKILYDLYGFSVALLGAIWDSVTSYLVHRRTRDVLPTRRPRNGPEEGPEQEEERTEPNASTLEAGPNSADSPRTVALYPLSGITSQ